MKAAAGGCGGAAYLAYVAGRFEEASRAGVQAREFEISGIPIRLEFAGDGMEAVLTNALRHLRPAGPPSLRLQAWDGASTGVMLPPPPLRADDFGPLGELVPYQNGNLFAVFAAGILSVFEADSGRGLCWIADAGKLRSWEQAAPLRSLLGAMLRSQNRHIVHGAAVGSNGRAALIVGGSGAGKSSSAIACFEAGMSYLGDDYCVLSEEPQGRDPMVHSLYSSAKLFPADAWRLNPETVRLRQCDRRDAKHVLYLADRPGPLFPAALPLEAILVPRITDAADSTVHRIKPSRVVIPALSSTAAQTPGAGGELLVALSRISRRVRCFEIHLGSSRRGVARAVGEALQRLESE